MLVIEDTKPASNHIESEQKSGLLIKYASLNSAIMYRNCTVFTQALLLLKNNI